MKYVYDEQCWEMEQRLEVCRVTVCVVFSIHFRHVMATMLIKKQMNLNAKKE